MIVLRRNFCMFFMLSLVISCVFATEEPDTKVDENENKDESEKKDEKTVSKRGAFHYSPHSHAHPAVVSASHYHLPPSVPVFAKYPVVHRPLPLPIAPVPIAAPVAPPHFHLAPGGASVTSFSVNYPRYPVLPRPIAPAYAPPVFAPAPPVIASAVPAFIPAHHHHHEAPHHHHVTPHHHHAAFVPNCHAHPAVLAPRPAIPVAIPYPGIRHPKYPVFFNQPKPIFANYPQFIPVPTPTFVPVAVPSNPQPASPPANPGTAQDTNINPATQEFPTLIMPTRPSFFPQPQPTMPSRPIFVPQTPMHTMSHGWRPIVMMTQHHHRPQATQPTFTNKPPPYNYHAPAVAFNHDQSSSTNDIVSGHGQMSSQLAHQLALYQHQQYQQQHQQQQHHQQYVQQQESKRVFCDE